MQLVEPHDLERRIERAVEAELALFGQEVVADVVDYINEPHGGWRIAMDGTLANSVISETDIDRGVVSVSIGPTALHGIFRHYGTRPHWAPIDPLKYWVKKKLGVSEPKDVDAIAYRVQRKIAKHGTEGDPFLSEPFNERRGTVAPRVADAIATAIGGRVA